MNTGKLSIVGRKNKTGKLLWVKIRGFFAYTIIFSGILKKRLALLKKIQKINKYKNYIIITLKIEKYMYILT